MKVSGIIAEFNPFHNGHKYIISEARKNSDCVIAVISGNYVQRGSPAFFTKFIRAKAAIENGVDIVVELPSPWSTSFAQNFAIGGVSILKELDIDILVFGCENEDLEKLKTIADSDKFNFTKNFNGTYATARQNAITETLGNEYGNLLTTPNNNLAIEYIKASKILKFNPDFKTIKRIGTKHDSDVVTSDIASASKLRDMLKENRDIFNFVPINVAALYQKEIKSGYFISQEKFSNAIISNLRKYKKFTDLPELSEGIENRLQKAILSALNYDEILNLVKTKRYTLARIRRLVLAAFLELDCTWLHKEVPYLNVLGFSKTGEQYLKEVSKSINKPLIFSMKPNKPLDKQAEVLLNKECERNDVYMSLLNVAQTCKSDYTHGLIKRTD